MSVVTGRVATAEHTVTESTPQLSESDVEAIEALAGLKSLNYTDVDYVLERVPALIRDWRALKAENATLKNHWADTSEDLASALLEHEQVNAALREQLAEAHGDNERLARVIQDIEEREAAVCPEDVGFDEYIRTLQRKLETRPQAGYPWTGNEP